MFASDPYRWQLAARLLCVLPALLLVWRATETSRPFDDAGVAVTDAEPALAPARRVPRVVHQTGPDILPMHWRGASKIWDASNPLVKYEYWTNKRARDFIASDFPWFLKTYDGYPENIQRADAMRYFVLYRYGGLYVDLDIQPLRSVESVFKKLENSPEAEVLLGQTSNYGVTNALMAAVRFVVVALLGLVMITPNSRLMKIVIDGLEARKDPWVGYVLHHFRILLSTGPTMLWIIVAAHEKTNPFDIVRLAPSVWGKCIQCVSECPITPDSLFKHVDGMSWIGLDTKFLNFAFLCHKQEFILFLGAVMAAMLFNSKPQAFAFVSAPVYIAYWYVAVLAAMSLLTF